MTRALALLRHAARGGRMLLIAGLAAGIALPRLALAMQPLLPWLIALLLFLAAVRVGPRAVRHAAAGLRSGLAVLLVFQLALPVALALGLVALGATGPLATGLVLMAAAAPISGSAGLAIMTRQDPEPALRLVVLGTALLPLTALPVLLILPELGTLAEVAAAALRLALVIAASVGAALALRALAPEPGPAVLEAIDGATALVMAVLVIGLMSGIAPALRAEPAAVALNLAVASAACFGLQIAATLALRRAGRPGEAGTFGICAGNRNIALFLAALPAATTQPLLLFIGCYQIPMYLTPFVLARFYRRAAGPLPAP
jgi:arsenite transporter